MANIKKPMVQQNANSGGAFSRWLVFINNLFSSLFYSKTARTAKTQEVTKEIVRSAVVGVSAPAPVPAVPNVPVKIQQPRPPVSVAQTPVRTFTSIFHNHFNAVRTIGDGNCFFRAVAYQSRELGASADGHHEARIRACQIMSGNRDEYIHFIEPLAEHNYSCAVPAGCYKEAGKLKIGDGQGNIDSYFDAYVAKMESLGTYATELQIKALSVALACPIVVLTQRSNGEISPTIHGETLGGDPIFIHYNGINHYSALNITSVDEPRAILAQIQAVQQEQATARVQRFNPR